MVIAYVPTSFWATVLARTGSALPYAARDGKQRHATPFLTQK